MTLIQLSVYITLQTDINPSRFSFRAKLIWSFPVTAGAAVLILTLQISEHQRREVHRSPSPRRRCPNLTK